MISDNATLTETLTRRETQVLDLVRVGLTNEEIARRLGISLDGAKYHVSQILSKLGVNSRSEAAVFGVERRPWWARAFGFAMLGQWSGAAVTTAAVAGAGVLTYGVATVAEPSLDGSFAQAGISTEYEDPYDFQSFGLALNEAIESGDDEFIVANAVPQAGGCAAQAGQPAVCARGTASGEATFAFSALAPDTSTGANAGLRVFERPLPESQFRAVIADFLGAGADTSDEFGGGAPVLFAYAIMPAQFRPAGDDLASVTAIATRINSEAGGYLGPQGRSALLLHTGYDGTSWSITGVTTVSANDASTLALVLDPLNAGAGAALFEFWARWDGASIESGNAPPEGPGQPTRTPVTEPPAFVADEDAAAEPPAVRTPVASDAASPQPTFALPTATGAPAPSTAPGAPQAPAAPEAPEPQQPAAADALVAAQAAAAVQADADGVTVDAGAEAGVQVHGPLP